MAASNGHEAVVRLLVEKGADVKAKNKNGGTALDVAASQKHEAVVRLLKGYGHGFLSMRRPR
jgi:ankyrin repeat protein